MIYRKPNPKLAAAQYGVFAFALATMLAGTPPRSATAAPALCSMFSANDIGRVLGATVAEPELRVFSSLRWSCTYKSSERIVVITIHQFASPYEASHDLVRTTSEMSNIMQRPMHKVPGVRDLALFIGSTIYMQRGSRTASVADIGGSDTEQTEIAKLAK